MGKGVLADGDLSPLIAFQLVLRLIATDSERIGTAAATLLKGERFIAKDDEVQIAYLASESATRSGYLTLRDADNATRMTTVIAVQGIHPATESRRMRRMLDSRSPIPIPDVWILSLSATQSSVELFNCRVCDIDFRPRT